MASPRKAPPVPVLEARALPTCVPCCQKRLKWDSRVARCAAPAPAPAQYRVTVGRSQVERFECAPCQLETRNPIMFRMELRP